MQGSSIVTATDLSDEAAPAALWARDLGRALGKPVVAAHVVEVGLKSWVRSRYEVNVDAEKKAGALAQIEAWYRAHAGEAPDAVDLEVDDCYSGLKKMVARHDAGVLAMTRSGKGAVMRTLMGSRVQQLVSRPPCPLAVVHPDKAAIAVGARVGVATDFSETAAGAVEIAARLARAVGGTLHIVHSLHTPELPVMPDLVVPAAERGLEQAARDELQAVADSVGEGLEVSPELRIGAPVTCIIEFATEQQLDLLVLGHVGDRSAIADVLGSVARGLITRAPCTVLVTGA